MPDDPLIGQLVDERWRVLDRVGAGGMGVVYRAERLKIFKIVALKFLDERCAQSPEAVARFEREARAISRVVHRHVVSILDFGVHQRRPYIVMEYLAGRPLSKEVGRPTMTPARGVSIVRQVLEALKHAHKAGVVHRDLKPENVMLMEVTGTQDFVKILDFGLARIISLDEPTISNPQRVAGTPAYMAPEQARGEKIDQRADLYAAGVMLYALTVGKKPFAHPDELEVLRMQLHAPPPPPRKIAPERNLSVALEKVILRALEKDRERRYYHAEEMLAALAATPEAGRAVGKTRRWGRLGAAVILVGMGAAGALAAREWLGRPLVVSFATDLAAPADLAGPSDLSTVNDLSRANDLSRSDLATPAELTTEDKVTALLASDQLADAERLLRAETILSPRAGWVHLLLGEVYFRRLWRGDALREWTTALQLDPALRRDPRLLERMCATLNPGWKGAGERFILTHLGRPTLQRCRDTLLVPSSPKSLAR